MNPSEPLVNPEPIAAVPVIAATPEPTSAGKIVGYCRECGKALLDGPGVHQALGAIYCEDHRPAAAPAFAPPQQTAWTAQPGAGSNLGSANPPSAAPPYTASPYSSQPYSNQPYSNQPYHASQPPPLPGSSSLNAGSPLHAGSPVHAGASPGLAFVLGLIPGVGAVYNGQYAKALLHVVIFGVLISVANNGASGFEPLFGLLIGCFYFYMPFEAYHTAKKRQAGVPVDEFSGVFAQSPFTQRSGASRVPVGPIVLIAIGVLFLLSNLEINEMRKLMRYWPALLIVMGVYMIYVRLAESREGKENGR
jgi:hypothetical protein